MHLFKTIIKYKYVDNKDIVRMEKRNRLITKYEISHYNKIHDPFDEEHGAINNNNYGSNSSPPTLTNINEDNLNNNETIITQHLDQK